MRSSAERLLWKTLNAAHTQEPRVINVDKNAAAPAAVDQLKADEKLPETTQLRQVQDLNNRALAGAQIHEATNQVREGIWFVQHSSGVPWEDLSGA